MINPQVKWYHYLSIRFLGQIAICFGSLLLAALQFTIYDIVEEDVVVFNDVCEVAVNHTYTTDAGKEKTYEGALAICGGDIVHLKALEAPYLYKVLTTDAEPVIMCEHTVSEFLKYEKWRCEIDPAEETT